MFSPVNCINLLTILFQVIFRPLYVYFTCFSPAVTLGTPAPECRSLCRVKAIALQDLCPLAFPRPLLLQPVVVLEGFLQCLSRTPAE